MESLLQDTRYGVRSLAKSPGFAAIAILTLAIGIGANTSIFSVIEAVVLRPLPYADPARLVLLADSADPEDGGFLYKDFGAIKSQSLTLEDIAAYYRDSGFSRVTITRAGEPQSVQGAFVTANFFSVMGVPAIVGRVFTSEEERHQDHVIVLSHDLWMNRFGGSSNVIGKTLDMDGTASQIIGIMPKTFQFPARDQQFWAPITINRYWRDPALLASTGLTHSGGFYRRWQLIGRLKPNVKVQQAKVEISALFQGIQQADIDPTRGVGIRVQPLHVNITGNTRLAFTVLFGAVVFVLMIACSNVANLLLARGSARNRELAVRKALGASRSRIVRQLLTENCLLALLSGGLGLVLSPLGVRSLVLLAPADIPRISEAGLDGRVLIFTLTISIIAAMLFGLVPAWRMADGMPIESFGSGISTSMDLKRTQGLLVVSEFAIATVLLVGSGLLVRSFAAIESVNPGFQADQILTMNISLPGTTPDRINSLYATVLERVRGLPGVEAVGAVDTLLDLGKISNLGLRTIEGRSPEPQERWTPLRWTTVRGDYFQAMGAPLLRGRYFSKQDVPNSPLVAIIDESMARRYWPGQDAIGKRFKGQDPRGQNDDWLTVVGVVRDMRRSGLDKDPIPHIYQPDTQAIDGYMTGDLVVRVASPSATIAQPLRAIVRQVDSSAILSVVMTMESELSDELSPRRFQTTVLSLFAFVALLLAGVGIYGVLGYSVTRRTHEIGIRMALGARPREMVRLVLMDGTRLAILGLIIGAIAAAVMTQFLKSLLFGIAATDPLTFLAAAILLFSLALLACYLPARRAALVDPIVALRYE
jgi:putative ABC transport system permease protein